VTISRHEPHQAAAATPGLTRQLLSALLVMVTLVQALATFAVLALPTLATRAAESFGIGAEGVGYQISIVYVAAAALSSIAGLLVRRLGAVLTSIAALALGALGLAATAGGQLASAVVASVLFGCGYALTNPAASHLLFRFAPRHRQNLIFALKQTGVPLGGVLAALLLPALADRFGWQAAMLIAAALLSLATLPLVMMRRRLDNDRDPATRMSGSMLDGVLMVVRHSRLRAFAVAGMTYASFQFCLFAFLITMLVADFGWSLVAAGQMATGMQVGGVVGRIAWSMLADRIGHGLELLAVNGLGSVLCALVLATATAAWPVWTLAVVLFGFGFCLIGWNGLWMAEIARSCKPHEVGLATGGVLVFTFSGIVLGPAAFATLYRALGSYPLTYGTFSAIALAGVAALLAARRGS
jgi:MFS family permease